MSNSSDYMV